MTTPPSVVVLAVSPRAAGLIKVALAIESEGPRRDDHSEEEIGVLENVVAEIDLQLKGDA